MVGIPKSNRCDFCRLRKTKCDEAWPTCGNCRKTDRVCSGPSKRVKFVHDGKHTRRGERKDGLAQENASTDTTSIAPDGTSRTTWVNLKERTTTSGATFSKTRILSQYPQVSIKVPESRVDVLASKVVTHLISTEGTGYNLSIVLTTLKQIPALLGSNEALFDATNLLLSTWTQLCQGKAPQCVLNLRSYNRALRSLQRALDDPRQQTASTTLAATVYLQMTEYLFDYSKGVNQISHSNGIHAIMMKRGAPKPGDDLGCQLILDSFGFMFQLILAGKIDNFFVQPSWRRALDAFFARRKNEASIPVEMSHVLVEMSKVINLMKRVLTIRNAPRSLGTPQTLEELVVELDGAKASFRALYDGTVRPLLEDQAIYEVEHAGSPYHTSYEFPDNRTAVHFVNMCAYNMVINKLKQEVNRMLGLDDPSLEEECRRWSARIGRACRYSLSLKPICAVSFNCCICIAYVSAGHAERAYLVSVLQEADSYRDQLGSRWTGPAVLTQFYDYMGW